MSDRVPSKGQPFKVVVRPRHFDQAVKENPHQCLIAQALIDAFPGLDAESLYVSTTNLRLLSDDLDDWPGSVRWNHDRRDLVRAFDQGLISPEDAKPGITVTFTPRV
jgi:hypothetical protein